MIALLAIATSPVWVLALLNTLFYAIAPRSYWPGSRP